MPQRGEHLYVGACALGDGEHFRFEQNPVLMV